MWHLDLRSNLQKRLFVVGSYEAATLRVAQRFAGDGVVVDVGANIGTFALPLAARCPQIERIIAVEPVPEIADQLSEHAHLNGLTERVMVIVAALGSREGTLELKAASATSTSDSGLHSAYGEGPAIAIVPMLSGDALVDRLGAVDIDVLKIDVEGFEYEVLLGFHRTFEIRPPRCVIVELSHHTQTRAGRDSSAIVELLASWGYSGHQIRAQELRSLSDTRRDGNALFVRPCASGTAKRRRFIGRVLGRSTTS